MPRGPLPQRFPDIEALIAAEPSELGAELVIIMQQQDSKELHAGNYINNVGWMYDLQSPTLELNLAVATGFAWTQNMLLTVNNPTSGSVGMLRLTRRGLEFTRDQIEIAHLRTILPVYMLHDEIRRASLAIFDAGHYEAAVLEAFKRLEICIREVAGADPHAHGAKLINDAFSVGAGPLQDMTAASAEREALRSLMAGAYGLMRNPAGHRDTGLDDPKEAAEMLVVASHLMRLVDRRRPAKAEADRGQAYRDKYG